MITFLCGYFLGVASVLVAVSLSTLWDFLGVKTKRGNSRPERHHEN